MGRRSALPPGRSAHASQAVVCVSTYVCAERATQKEQTDIEPGMTRGSQACLGSGSQLTQCRGPGTPPRDRATWRKRPPGRNDTPGCCSSSPRGHAPL
eukprot:1983612-Prymnesium_polylepis.1